MDYLAGWLFVTLTVFLLLGFPVAFTLLGVSFFFGLFGFGLDFFKMLPLRVWGVMANPTLVAVPVFIFMGMVLERSGVARDLIESLGFLCSRLRGGLALAVVLVGGLLGACTGVIGATVVTLGVLALPVMIEKGYPADLTTGVIAASGSLGQIIPPSIILVLLGSVMGISVGDLFMGALFPGLILMVSYCVYIIVISTYSKRIPAPAIDIECENLFKHLLASLLPPFLLIFTVLGSIFVGAATPTEAAGVGAFGALLLCAIRGRLGIKLIQDAMLVTTRLTSMVFIILVGATSFGLVFRGLGGDDLVRQLISLLPFGKYGILLAIMAGTFLLGFFLDLIEITFIHIPILAPIMIEYDFNPVWIAILFAINLQTSFLTPPIGFALFYLKGVMPPELPTASVYRGVIPFVLIQLAVLALVAIFPELATWLPNVLDTNSLFYE